MSEKIRKNRFLVPVLLLLIALGMGGLFLHSLFAERYAQTADTAIQTGKAQLFGRTVSGALEAFRTFQTAAAGADYAGANNAQKIKIRAYLAFTRMLDLFVRNDGGSVDTLAELLAQYGVAKTGDAFDAVRFNLPLNDDGKIILPSTAPPSAEALKAFFAGPFLTAVNASIADMDAAIALCPISGAGDDVEIIAGDLIAPDDSSQPDVEMDAGDYYLFRAFLKFLKGYALMCAGYDADLDIREVVALINMEAGQSMFKRVLDLYPDFLKISDAAKMNEARLALIDAITDYEDASARIRGDASTQTGAEELFNLDPDDYGEALLRENLAKIKTSLQEGTSADLVTERIGTEYYVYGGSAFDTTEADWWEKGYHPEQYGYTPLGKATSTATFRGAHNYYIITTKPGNMAPVDAVQGSDSAYYKTSGDGNTSQWWNVGGIRDGSYALVGGVFGGNHGGFIVIYPDTSISSLTVYLTNKANIAREEHVQLNPFPLFGNGAAVSAKSLRDMLPQINAYGYPLSGTMGSGLGNDPTLGGILPEFTTQEQWQKGMDGIFMPTGLLTTPQVADDAITVDGAADDWTAKGISPALIDITGERENMAANGDLQKVYLAKDSQYLYIRMDLAGNWDLAGQNFMYGLRFRQSPGEGPDKPGDLKLYARNRSGNWDVKVQSLLSNYTWSPSSSITGGSAAASGNIVEWKVPLVGSAAGRFLAADTDAWYYDTDNPSGWEWWYPYDNNRTCLQIQPSASLTGTLTVPGYDRVGPVRIGVFKYDGSFDTNPQKRIGGVTIYPGISGTLPENYTIENLAVGAEVFVFVFWDRDANGVVTPGDYTGISHQFTTSTTNTANLSVHNERATYPAPQITLARVRNRMLQGGYGSNQIYAYVTGPSRADVMVTVTGPGGEYRLYPQVWIANKFGLTYMTGPAWLPDGDYTFTAVDSLGRKAETTVHYVARYDLPTVTQLSPAAESYLGTTTPTLSWTPPATGGSYAYQILIQDYNYPNVLWYVSDITTSTSLTVPSGALRSNSAYKWYLRLFASANEMSSCTETAINSFYTGTYDAEPVFTWIKLGTFPPAGSVTNYKHLVEAKLPGVAPWDITGWRLKKGDQTIYGSGYAPYFYARDTMVAKMDFQELLAEGSDYRFELDVKRSTTPLVKTGLSYTPQVVETVDYLSLLPASNYYFQTLTPTFSWRAVSDSDTYYRLRIYDPLNKAILYSSSWSKNTSATVPAGILKPGGSYYWTVMTSASDPANASYTIAYTHMDLHFRTSKLFTINPIPPGDVTGDFQVTLGDAITACQVISGMKPEVTTDGDVNKDGRVGLPEAVYILQDISELR